MLLLPTYAAIFGNIFIIVTVHSYISFYSFGVMIVTLPLTVILLVSWYLLVAFATKRLVIGDFHNFLGVSKSIPMNSRKLLVWEIANMMIGASCYPALMIMDEFWVTSFFWRLMGASIGERTMIDPHVLILEADYLKIGNDCRIEDMATLLCHKFSNGRLEMLPIDLPSNTFIGSHSVILPGSRISGTNVKVMPLTLVMTNEEVTDGVWHGSPAELVNVEGGRIGL